MYAAREALKDALDDGQVVINGKSYSIDPVVLSALVAETASFHSGVIGPAGSQT